MGKEPGGPNWDLSPKFSMETSSTRTEDIFEFTHSTNRVSKKWVTKTFRCLSATSALLISIHFHIFKLVTV